MHVDLHQMHTHWAHQFKQEDPIWTNWSLLRSFFCCKQNAIIMSFAVRSWVQVIGSENYRITSIAWDKVKTNRRTFRTRKEFHTIPFKERAMCVFFMSFKSFSSSSYALHTKNIQFPYVIREKKNQKKCSLRASRILFLYMPHAHTHCRRRAKTTLDQRQKW